MAAPEVARRLTALIATRWPAHEMSFAREVADRVVFMDEGLIVEQGDPAQVIGSPQHAAPHLPPAHPQPGCRQRR